MNKRNRVILHLIFWIIDITFSFFVFQLPSFEWKHPLIHLYDCSWAHITAILYFYINYYFIVPRFLLKKKYIQYVIYTGLNIVVFIILSAYFWNHYEFRTPLLSNNQISNLVNASLYYFLVSTAIKMLDYWLKSEMRRKILEREIKETELLYLKSQMSPHFLFNTLNNIYGLSLKNNPQTSLAISQLKDLMIYMANYEKSKKIALLEEINYLKSFIALNKLRSIAKTEFNIKDDPMLNLFQIEPMILLPFFENAFKHGYYGVDGIVIIDIFFDKNSFNFSIKNTINIGKRKDAIGGIGIPNVKRRLELLYPENYNLNAFSENGWFMVELKINFDENL